MARPLRVYVPGAWYHVTARGNERRAIVRDDSDRDGFLTRLAATTVRFRLNLYAYVLMQNHFHLLMEPSEDNLSRAMQWLNVSYSQWFNRRRQRTGHLFQGRFKSIVVDWQRWGLELSRYVHLNPVRTRGQGLSKAQRARHQAGVGKSVGGEVVRARLEALRAWRWSSYRAYVGLAVVPDWLNCEPVLRLVGGKRGRVAEDVSAVRREGGLGRIGGISLGAGAGTNRARGSGLCGADARGAARRWQGTSGTEEAEETSGLGRGHQRGGGDEGRAVGGVSRPAGRLGTRRGAVAGANGVWAKVEGVSRGGRPRPLWQCLDGAAATGTAAGRRPPACPVPLKRTA